MPWSGGEDTVWVARRPVQGSRCRRLDDPLKDSFRNDASPSRCAGRRGARTQRSARIRRIRALPRTQPRGVQRGSAAQGFISRRVLKQLDGVADGDVAGLDDPREHAALAVELRAQALPKLVHSMTWIADHRDLEHGLVADTHALADRPLLHVRALNRQVLPDRTRLDVHRLEVLRRYEQHLALRRVRVRAALDFLPRDRTPADVPARGPTLA